MKNRELCLERTKRRHRELKAIVVAHYGGACKCCGEHRIEFLTIDHINRDGPAHRRALAKGNGDRFYGALIKHGFPETVRLFCMNCNWGTRYGKTCPHELERRAADEMDHRPPVTTRRSAMSEARSSPLGATPLPLIQSSERTTQASVR